MSWFSAVWRRLWPAQAGGPSDWEIAPVAMGFQARIEEVWRYRKLWWFFASRLVTRKYQGTTLGVFWLFWRPLGPVLISTFIFGKFLKVPSDGLPYFLFFLTGTSIWLLFERSLLWVTRSVDMNKGIIKKLYFPRVIVPASAAAPGFVDFFLYMGLILVGAGYYLYKDHRWYLAFGPGWLVAFLAAFGAVLLATAVGLFTSVWQVRHKEVRYGLRYFTRFWMYVTPVIYPMSQVPPHLRWVIYLNPMAALVETFKWGLLGVGTFPVVPLLSTVLIIPVIMVLGLWYFTNSEAATVDEL